VTSSGARLPPLARYNQDGKRRYREDIVRAWTKIAAVAATAFLAALPARAETFINILTGGTSGVYYPLGVALSQIFADHVEGARPSVQATKASVENLNLLQQGKGEIAFTLGDSLALAVAGNADAGFPAPLDKLRTVAAIYPNYIQIVASQESGIKTIADLKGKRLSVGAPKSGTELNARAILSAAGISYEDLGKVEYLPFAESVELMKNRQLDATLQSAGLGVASIRDLASSVPITVVEVPADLIAKVGPPYQAGTIPAGTYEGQDADVETAAVVNYLVTHSDVSDDVVYGMTKALFENLDDMAAAHAAAKAIDLKVAAKDPPAPLHPGAERYYTENNAL
jgi:TRAP transporter TAXI family solute receptor